MGGDGTLRTLPPAPLALLRCWLDCRCLALEWQGEPPAATTVWAALLGAARREADDALWLPLGAAPPCRLRAVGETDCYAWEALLRLCAERHCGAPSCWPAVPAQRGLRQPCLDAGGRLLWRRVPPRCAATRRWLQARR
jgi:hypothetical protein